MIRVNKEFTLNISRNTKKVGPYLIPLLLLFICLTAIFFLLQDKAPAILGSAIGVSFGLFQVLLNISIQGARNRDQLRYTEYKELIKIMNSISDTVNEAYNSPPDVDKLSLTLTTQINQFTGFVKNNSYYLFKGLDQNPTLIKARSELFQILRHTMAFRKDKDKIDIANQKIAKSEKEGTQNELVIIHYNWCYNIHESLENFSNIKFEVLKEVQDYFK